MVTSLSLVSDEVRKHWGWYLGLGIGLVILGIISIILEVEATLAGVAVFGAIVAVAGILQIVGAFRAHGAGHIFVHLLLGVLDFIVGLLVLAHPLAGALILTLLFAVMFLVGGIFRAVSALAMHYPHYGWAVLSGIVSIILGILLWVQWPVSALWFIGLCIGINFIFLGASWIALANRLHHAAPMAAVNP